MPDKYTETIPLSHDYMYDVLLSLSMSFVAFTIQRFSRWNFTMTVHGGNIC